LAGELGMEIMFVVARGGPGWEAPLLI